MKANCYQCKYRGNVPGDTHSRCKYPGTKSDLLDFFLYQQENIKIAKELNLGCDLYGLRSGWFFWPSNFDPVWLTNCDGFTQKKEDSV